MNKKLYLSKTLGFNLLAGALVLANVFGFADFVPDSDVIAVAGVLGNILLRFVTKQPLGWS